MPNLPANIASALTPAEARALKLLVGVVYATPAQIGHAVAESRTKRPGGMKDQGAGRLGGTVASRLVKKGLAEDASRLRSGYPAYRINAAGRKAYAAHAERSESL